MDASPDAAATVTVSLVAVSVGPGVRNSRDTASPRISRCSASMSEPRARVVSVRSRRSCPLSFSTRSLRSKATSPRNWATCSLSACSISRRKVRSNCAWYSRYSRRGSGAVRIPTSLYTDRETSRPVETACGSSSRRGGRKYATTAAQIPSSTPIRNCFWESPRTTRATAMAPSPSTNKMPNHRTKVRPRERGIWRAYRRKRVSQGGWPECLRSESAYQSGAFPLAGRLVEGSIPARSNKRPATRSSPPATRSSRATRKSLPAARTVEASGATRAITPTAAPQIPAATSAEALPRATHRATEIAAIGLASRSWCTTPRTRRAIENSTMARIAMGIGSRYCSGGIEP